MAAAAAAATPSFRSKFSGFHLENITCPRAVFTGSIRELSVGDPAAHLRAARIRENRGSRGATYDAAAVRSPCTKPRDTIRFDGGQAYRMERSSAVILGVPFLSDDFPVPFSHRRRSKMRDGQIRPYLSRSSIALYYLRVIFL